jgi:hypothetical protein
MKLRHEFFEAMGDNEVKRYISDLIRASCIFKSEYLHILIFAPIAVLWEWVIVSLMDGRISTELWGLNGRVVAYYSLADSTFPLALLTQNLEARPSKNSS